MDTNLIKYKECPVCNSDLIRECSDVSNHSLIHYNSIECKNGCFGELFIHSEYINGYIFEEKFSCNVTDKESVKLYLSKIYEKAAYWKENDRYLVKLLTK